MLEHVQRRATIMVEYLFYIDRVRNWALQTEEEVLGRSDRDLLVCKGEL